MGILDALGRRNGEADKLREQLQQERWQNDYLSESMSTLELSLEDEGWRKLTLRTDREFTRGGLDELMRISRAMYLSHPLIQRAVNVRTYYTFGQGMEVKAVEDEVQEKIVEPLLSDRGNRADLVSHQARILTDVDQQVEGNIFTALFDRKGEVAVRSIPAEEIREIVADPEDRTQVWFYKRSWNEQRFDSQRGIVNAIGREAFYPDWRYEPGSRPSSIGGVPVMWASPVIHQRTGGLKHMQFGIPETYAALDWARAYRKFLEDWHTIVASLARFAWKQTSKGSKLAAAKTKLASTISSDQPTETNPPPTAGSVFIGAEDSQLTPIPKSGAHTSAEDARPSRMMVGAAMDLPDTILSGDADVGNLATAKSLDRPTELAIAHRQQLWADFYRDIFDFATERAARANVIPNGIDRTVEVTFPPILEHDAMETVRSIVTAATLDGKLEAGTMAREDLSRLLLQALGVEDVQAALEKLDDTTRNDLAQAVERLSKAVSEPG